MTRRDGAFVAVLVLILVVIGGTIALPHAAPSASGSPEPTPGITLPPPVTYREGVVGSPTSVTPVTARSRADRTLVGLVFSGLVRPAAAGGYEPDLAESWATDAAGTTWTVKLRPDATWHDGVETDLVEDEAQPAAHRVSGLLRRRRSGASAPGFLCSSGM